MSELDPDVRVVKLLNRQLQPERLTPGGNVEKLLVLVAENSRVLVLGPVSQTFLGT
jgi:hypothetical protein